LERRLSRVKGELRAMKEESTTVKKEEAAKKEDSKRPKKTIKDMEAKWWKNGGQ
jgi:hypothetical protein